MDLRTQAEIEVDPSLLMVECGLTPDPWQARALRSEAKRLLILAARQLGKSTTAALIALHPALFRPNSLILLVSKSERQSIELLKKVMLYYRMLDDPVPATRVLETTLELANGSRIIALPGDPDTIRGFSAPWMVIIDEASRVGDDVFAAVQPMLLRSGGRLVGLSTPKGSLGFFAREWNRDDVEWEKIVAKASESPHVKPKELEDARKLLGEVAYMAEYECAFLGQGSTVYRNVGPSIDRGRTEHDIPVIRDPRARFGMGVDLGKTNDSTVITILDGNGRQVFWQKLSMVGYPAQISAIKAARTILQEVSVRDLPRDTPAIVLDEPTIVVDGTGGGLVLCDMLQNEGVWVTAFVFTNPKKEEVVQKLAAAFDTGGLRLMDIPEQEQQLIAYQVTRTEAGFYRYSHPPGGHDDSVTALQLAYYAINDGWIYVDRIGAY